VSRREQDVKQELERFCAQARERGVRAVFLFGSRATGQHTKTSDADVGLIAADLPADLWQRRSPAPSGYRFLSVIGFHPREFLHMLRQGNPLVLDIMHDGVILYDDGFMRQAQAGYQETTQRLQLRRARGGWNWSQPRAHHESEGLK
jgi:hypothetical protein